MTIEGTADKGTLREARASFTKSELAKALDDHLPRMAFHQYGQFYNDDPDFDIEAYYDRVADAMFSAAISSKDEPLDVERYRRAGMDALRGYHMEAWRDVMTARPHNHPVEECPREPWKSLAAALSKETPA